ncbi:MAG: restriction endonuclease subunit S [Sulfurovum sp.]|nr:restriction endonuclease subunit S [Sulfurovum sp.]
MSELYELPEGWEWKKLGDISKLIGGGTPKRNNLEFWDNGTIIWLSPTDLGKIGEIIDISDSKDKITELGLKKSSARLLPIGTVLYSSRATIGKIAINSVEVSTNQGFTNFICNDELSNKYLAYCLNRFTDKITSLSNSTTFKEVSKTSLKEFNIPLPPLQEQKRIVAKLDSLFAKIDQAIALHQQNIDEANALMGSVLNEVFGELEERYEKDIIKNILKIAQYGFSTKSSDNGRYPFLRMGDLQNGKILFNNLKYVNLTDTEFKKYKLEKNDLLFNRTNSYELVGKTSIFEDDIDMSFASYLIRLRVDESIILPYFLNYYLNAKKTQDSLKEMATRAVNQSNINAQKLQSISVPLPPLSVQQKTITYLDQLSQKTEKLKQAQQEKMESLKDLKVSLLDRAFRGEL